jgi:peptidoglycan/xylan/chitin deacetylase (PgdA/CDA1 family)
VGRGDLGKITMTRGHLERHLEPAPPPGRGCSLKTPPPLALIVAAAIALGCAAPVDPPPPPPASAAPTPPPPPPPPPVRPQLDGRDFPDKVLALTWDDGPDAGTYALADYLRSEHVSATFFVVGAWVEGVSSDPGWGSGVFETGHEALPLLGDLVALGHRLGNHTLNHVLLDGADAGAVDTQLREDQRAIDPFITNDLRLFRAPGGAWSAAASAVVDGDPALAPLVGPIRWDVDRKDWEGSVYCQSSRPAVECEHAGPGGQLRTKPSVVARRYLESIEEAGHGIVLLHDRVGHVGSDYPLRIARELVPELVAHGFVFAAPVLRFSPLSPHAEGGGAAAGLADVDGDGRADRCEHTGGGIVCALSRGGSYGAPRKWSIGDDFIDPSFEGTIRFGDVNGDGRTDACGRTRDGVFCSLSTGRGFTKATLWQPGMSDAAGWGPYAGTIQLVDVNGDGRADLCGRGPDGFACSLAP